MIYSPDDIVLDRVHSFFTSDHHHHHHHHFICSKAFDQRIGQLRLHLVTVGRIDQMRSAFGQTRQMRARLANCSYAFSVFFFTSDQRNWPNARLLAKRARNLPNVAHLVKCHWSNALRIWPNAQIGQMRLYRYTPIQHSTVRIPYFRILPTP